MMWIDRLILRLILLVSFICSIIVLRVLVIFMGCLRVIHYGILSFYVGFILVWDKFILLENTLQCVIINLLVQIHIK